MLIKILLINFGLLLITINCNTVTRKLNYILNEVFKSKDYNNISTTTTTTIPITNLTTGNEEIKSEIKEVEKEEEEEEEQDEKVKTFIDYYRDGVKAYLVNDWEMCIDNLERSLSMYRNYYDTITDCRIQCEHERNHNYTPKYQENFEHRHFFEGMIYKTLCMEKCKRLRLTDIPKYFIFHYDNKEIFKRRKPYEYLQLCYYRDNEIEKAISATYTALVMNPGDELMKKNIIWYAKQQQFDIDKLTDLEDKQFSSYYLDGIDKYDKKSWNEAIELFERAIDLWLHEHNKCRAFCEGEFYQGWMPDFVTSASNHYVYSIKCKQNCTTELSYVNGRYYDDLYPSMYNYLQYAYYQVGRKKDAVQCAESFLLFYPKSEEMLSNINFYKVQADITRDFFKPREEARKLYYRDFYEKELLLYIDDEFMKLTKETELIKKEQKKQQQQQEQKHQEKQQAEQKGTEQKGTEQKGTEQKQEQQQQQQQENFN